MLIISGESDQSLSEEGDLLGKLSLLKKYSSLLSSHVTEVMPLAISYGNEGPTQFVQACNILQNDVIGHLLPEFAMSLTLFQLESDQSLMSEPMGHLPMWLQMFDQFNAIAPGALREDADDMTWPGSAKYKVR